MLTVEQNDRITRVGPGTPMGELMRRYWQPIAASVELSEQSPTKEIRLLGEDLVLYRDTSGTVGCVEPSCAHRKASLAYGVPEANGIRCCYHGWLFNERGECLEQPSEPQGSRFSSKVRLRAYPAQELGGLIFVYMGPAPVPVLPVWDILAWPGVTRSIEGYTLPCNWLQCQENSLDPLHFQWLHRYYGGWVMSRETDQGDEWKERTRGKGRDHVKIGFDKFEFGVIKRRLLEGEKEDDEYWKTGHPILFPNILRVGRLGFHSLQFRVPIDDTHTWHCCYSVNVLEGGAAAPSQDVIPYSEPELYDSHGKVVGTFVVAQDMTAWIAQGAISDRPTEALGATDVGVIMFRRMLDEQAKIVEDGGEPINVHRHPAAGGYIPLAIEHCWYPASEADTMGPKDTRTGTVDVVGHLK